MRRTSADITNKNAQKNGLWSFGGFPHTIGAAVLLFSAKILQNKKKEVNAQREYEQLYC